MMIFSCCETEKEDPDAPKETPPTVVSPQTPVINVISDKILTYKVNDTAKALAIEAKVTDNGKLSYKWSKSVSENGTFNQIENATSNEYIPVTSATGTLYYKCKVTNTLDGKTASAESPIFTVTVTAEEGEATAPQVTAEKTEYETEVKKPLTLNVSAKSLDGGSLSYKWSESSDKVNFSDLPDENSSSLTFTAAKTGTFYYKCEVTNSVEIDGTIKTASADIVFTVTVTAEEGEASAPQVTAEKTEYETKVNKTLTLNVNAKSLDGGSLSYKWSESSDKVNFSDLPDETSSSLTFTAAKTGTFYYKCEVTNSVEVDGTIKTASADIVFTVSVTVIPGSGSINIDFN